LIGVVAVSFRSDQQHSTRIIIATPTSGDHAATVKGFKGERTAVLGIGIMGSTHYLSAQSVAPESR
jgi:hypothetical protein